MYTPYYIDRDWFVSHPTMQRYQRAPLPEEWQEMPIPSSAIVTVHLINERCTVRVLELPKGKRLASVLDTDAERCIVDMFA